MTELTTSAFRMQTRDPADIYEARFRNGLITCTVSMCRNIRTPDAAWCRHLEFLIKNNHDSQMIWEDERDLSGAIIHVPVFPNHNIWVVIDVNDSAPGGSYSTSFDVPSLAGGTPITTFLGFFGPGEGLNVLRQMLLDWFQQLNTTAMQCHASSHKFKEESAWSRNMKDRTKRQVEFWSVLMDKMCLTCAAKISNADDLVPS